MNQANRQSLVAVLLSLGLLLTLPASSLFAQGAASAEAAISIALERNGGEGKVLSVKERSTDGGGSYYMIKVLQDGKVRIFKVDKEL